MSSPKTTSQSQSLSQSQYQSFEYVENIPIPRELPTVSYRYQPYGGNNKNRPVLIRYGNGPELRLINLNKLKEKIVETKLKYVYPIVFVQFAKKYINKDDIKFDDQKLFKLRIWANQLRDSYRDNQQDVVDYLTYIIGSKIIKYASK